MPESRTPRHNAIFEQLHIWRKPSACHHLVPNYMLSLSSCFCHSSVFCSEAAGSLQMLLMIQSAFWLSKRNKHHDLFHRMFKLFFWFFLTGFFFVGQKFIHISSEQIHVSNLLVSGLVSTHICHNLEINSNIPLRFHFFSNICFAHTSNCFLNYF